MIILFIGPSTTSADNLRASSPISPDNIYTLIEEQLALGPRIPGSEGSLAFKDWITGKISSPWKIQNQTFMHKEVELNNYIITSESQDELPPILLAAHFDSRAVANEDSDPLKRDEPVPGANDGGSGVAALIELLKHIPSSVQNMIAILLFDGEDQGSGGMEGWYWIVGSTYFAGQMTSEEVENTEALILLDMIGDDDLRLPYETNSDTGLIEQFWSLADNLGYGGTFINEPGPGLIDDHRPFEKIGIATLDIIDFTYPEWHTTNDDLDHISAENIAIVTDVLLNWLILNYASDDDMSSFTENTEPFNSTTENSNITFFIIPTMIILIISIFKKSRFN